MPALALIVGLLLGGAVVAVTGPRASQTSDTSASGQATSSSPTTGTTPSDLVLTVPGECLRLTDDSQRLLDLVAQAATAARDLDAAALSALVSQLQAAQQQLQTQTDACRTAATSTG